MNPYPHPELLHSVLYSFTVQSILSHSLSIHCPLCFANCVLCSNPPSVHRRFLGPFTIHPVQLLILFNLVPFPTLNSQPFPSNPSFKFIESTPVLNLVSAILLVLTPQSLIFFYQNSYNFILYLLISNTSIFFNKFYSIFTRSSTFA